MGLAVSVGSLADLNANDPEGAEWLRDALSRVNALLAENNHPAHTEPEDLPALQSRAALESYPYSFLHYLRRFAAHASEHPNWTPKPFPKSEDPADDPVVERAAAMFDSHLLCHSDCEGFYVPIEFDSPLFSLGKDPVPGGMLGSSQGLMRELVAIAPFLGITLQGNSLSDAEAERINSGLEHEGPFWIESSVWLSLFEAARLSIEHRTAISFG